MSRVKKARQRALRNAVERDMTAEEKKMEALAASQMLSRCESLACFFLTSFQGLYNHAGK